MKNTFDFKSFKNLKKGNSLITEDVIAIGDSYRVRGFDVPKALISSFKKKAKDSGNDISGKFADTELAEFIAKYVQTKFLTIDNLSLDVLGDEFAGVTVQTQVKPQIQMQPQAQVQTQPTEGQNVQAQATAQKIPAQEGGQGQGAIQGQGQTQTPTQEI